ncbi:MAG: ACT domain-containing protein, partial [Acidimicrobiia bacterium]
AFWYPLWDAGFVLGHAARTAKESVKLAEHDLETLTGLLDPRWIGGAFVVESQRLVADVRRLARRHRTAVIDQMADASTIRRVRPGPISEMLEPNLKDGAGGLRDLHALTWAGWCDGEAQDAGEYTGAWSADDRDALRAANDLLLDVRVGLHRASGGRSDVLALQDQDAVAELLAFADADELIHDLAAASRRVAWIAGDVWSRARDTRGRPRRGRGRPTMVAAGVVAIDSRIGVATDATVDGALVLRVARSSAERGLPIDRNALARLRTAAAPIWNDETRADFVAVLESGPNVVDVFEALDLENLVSRILPEWERIRFRPQRNAYHRFTVDRHLLETVAEAAKLRAGEVGSESGVAAALEHPELLALGALLHDITKGRPGDHAVTGSAVARDVGLRLGLAEPLVEMLAWLVLDHLLMADTATRRDLADPVTIEQFASRVRTPERLRLLRLLTVADSRATGPAAWGPGKAALVRELYDRTVASWQGRAAHLPVGADSAAPIDSVAGPGVVVVWETLADGRLRATVGAPDRSGLLAGVAGALSLEGFDIAAAEGHTVAAGRAAEVFVGTDRFDRLGDDAGRLRAATTVRRVLNGEVSVADDLRTRRAVYARSTSPGSRDDAVRIEVKQDASDDATVIEVFAPDEIGLLATVAAVFGALDFDVSVARVSTTGDQAVDVFYVQDHGRKVTDPRRIAGLRRALVRALTGD